MLIGEFQAAKKAATGEPNQFKLNGELFTLSGKDQTIVMGEFAEAAMSGLDTAEMEGLAAMMKLLKGVVVDEDVPRLIRTLDGVPAETIWEIVGKIVEAETGRPTQEPSASLDGSQSIGASSKESSFSGAMRHQPGDPRAEGLTSIEQGALQLLTG